MGGLSFSDRARRSMWRIVPKRAVSGAIGWGVSLGIPAGLRELMLSRFARVYGIDVSEAEKPLAEYAGFDEFFTRKLRARASSHRRRAGSRRVAGRRHRRRMRPRDGRQIAAGEGEPLRPRRPARRRARRLRGSRAAPTSSPTFRPRTITACIRPSRGRVVGWRHVPGTLFSVGAPASGASRGCSSATNASSR